MRGVHPKALCQPIGSEDSVFGCLLYAMRISLKVGLFRLLCCSWPVQLITPLRPFKSRDIIFKTVRNQGFSYYFCLLIEGSESGSGPHVLGPPGFGSFSQRYGSGSRYGSFYQRAKIVRKTLIPTVLWLLLDFLSLKNDVNVPSKSNKQKNFFYNFLKLVYCWHLEGQWRKSQDPDSDPLIGGMHPRIRTTPKCHGSGTLCGIEG